MPESRRALTCLASLATLVLLAGCAQEADRSTAAAQPLALVQPAAASPNPSPVRPERTPGLTAAQTARLEALRVKARRITSYQMTATSSEGETVAWVAVRDGRATRVKLRTGPQSWRIYDQPKQAIYSTSPYSAEVFHRKMAAGYRMPATAFASIAPLLDAAESVSEASVGNVPCLKVVVGRDASTMIVVWLDTEWGLPRRLAAGNFVTRFRYDQINAVPEAAYALPAGMPVTEASSSMGYGAPYMPPPPVSGMPASPAPR